MRSQLLADRREFVSTSHTHCPSAFTAAGTLSCRALGFVQECDLSSRAVAFVFVRVVGGFLLSESHIPEYATWIADVSFINYAFEALAINEFSDPDVIYTFKAALPAKTLPPLRCHGDYVCCL